MGHHERKDLLLTRRQMLARCTNGFGALALGALATDRAYGNVFRQPDGRSPLAPRTPPLAPKARNVIFLYMDGAPSQVDTFDPKPRLDRDDGKPIPMKVPPTQFDNVGTLLRSPWTFRRYGESGIPVSDLFPHVGECVDDIAVIRSMVSNFSEHTNANYFIHTGHGLQGRPSWGSWVTYGLGTECQDLPGFVVLNGGLIPRGGLDCFNSGFLPADFQGSVFRAGTEAVADIVPKEKTAALQRRKLELLAKLDKSVIGRAGDNADLDAAIANYELAFRMQAAVPDLMDLRGESEATKKLYGMDSTYGPERTYGTVCLLARRLVERGVRFIELTCPKCKTDRWDQHGNLKVGHERNARAVDRPIAGLLTDLKARGLFENTLVIWSGEFGRTPMAQGRNGRDHNPFGFSCWLAGAGIRGGTVHGATDEFGYFAVEDRVEIHDLHATVMHLLGIDHEKLTYRFSGRDIRLTDVHGDVIHPILA